MFPRLIVRQRIRQTNRCRWLSTTTSSSSDGVFRPRRRPNPNYRPLKPLAGPGFNTNKNKDNKIGGLFQSYNAKDNADEDNEDTFDYDSIDDIEETMGEDVANVLRDSQRNKRLGTDGLTTEEYLSMADYMTAAPDSLEEKQIERRSLSMQAWDEDDRSTFVEELDKQIEECRYDEFNIESVTNYDDEDDGKPKSAREQVNQQYDKIIQDAEQDVDEKGEKVDPLRLAHGQWSETIVRVDRVQKVQKGGTMVRYRALLIGGNGRGCAGFGVGKANSPQEATQVASRICKRNVFFVDPHSGGGLVRSLAGRHNSCRVRLLSVSPHYGLQGHPLICDLLLFFGITDCTAKSFGNRSQYNVIMATIKALLTNESLEEIARRRGKRLLNLEYAKELQV
mmetsp:Transcript_13567/g.15083  ORF Transcript_13567/g.15083 Transcript_13567/m.15083 type:complete len:394 (-) Transcript_13567:50-1231(-)|eukprot:CAMPEP_0194132224 /NCGR_PEP_ID=MMETSP0152-20130528/2743_1 /TAXON_ID=1049557 /ORGANISM="Thalassiothrix antarctica, Strain L6-D1" /LENGTH=393 /DNA_ID=CAMNT_0038827195 /DNA_START=77 /DNA_END=1258 /DNA_ORIENTATION=+